MTPRQANKKNNYLNPEKEGVKDFLKSIGTKWDNKQPTKDNLRKIFTLLILSFLIGSGGLAWKFLKPDVGGEVVSSFNSVKSEVLGVNISSSTIGNIIANNIATNEKDCKYWRCVRFDDWEEWTTHPNIKIFPGKKLCAVKIKNDRGGTILLKKPLVSGEFTIIADFTPLGKTELNTSFVWGDNFDFRIGEAKLDVIALKTPAGYVAPLGNLPGYNNYRLENKIQPSTPIHLELDVKFGSSETLIITPTISYTSVDGVLLKDLKLPAFVASTTQTTWKIQEEVGIKLFDWNNKGDICSTFNNLFLISN